MTKKIKHQDVLNFWFTEIAPELWFKKDANFDAALKSRFGQAVSAVEATGTCSVRGSRALAQLYSWDSVSADRV